MAGTPVVIACRRYPTRQNEILAWTKKWSNYTKKLTTQWPIGGTFDGPKCADLDVIIRNYKPNKTSTKAQEKRAKAREILKLFQKEGEIFQRNIAQFKQTMRLEAAKSDKSIEEPVQIKKRKLGEHLDHPPASDSVGQFAMVKGTVHINGEVDIEKDEDDKPALKLDEEATSKINCYEQLFGKVSFGEEKSGSECPSPPPKLETPSMSPPRRRRDRGEQLQGAWGMELEDKGMMAPILIKGTQVTYLPWPTQDLEGLVNSLPKLPSGASKFIKLFEQNTVGKLLALGDIKALLVRTIGMHKADQVLAAAGLPGVLAAATHDGIAFDAHRNAIWKALRTEYPTRVDPAALRGTPLGSEDPITYIHSQVQKWRLEAETDVEDIENNPVMTSLFRKAVVEAMPTSVRSRLEDVVGLTSSLPHKGFCDHVCHVVLKHRQQEAKIAEQAQEIQKKLALMQLDELCKKDKKRGLVANSTPSGLMAPVTSGQAIMQPAQEPMNAQPTAPPPVINVYSTPKPATVGLGQKRNFTSTIVCYRCGMPGHMRINCTAKLWGQNPNAARRNQNPYGNQNPRYSQPRGPKGSWAGKNY